MYDLKLLSIYVKKTFATNQPLCCYFSSGTFFSLHSVIIPDCNTIDQVRRQKPRTNIAQQKIEVHNLKLNLELCLFVILYSTIFFIIDLFLKLAESKYKFNGSCIQLTIAFVKSCFDQINFEPFEAQLCFMH